MVRAGAHSGRLQFKRTGTTSLQLESVASTSSGKQITEDRVDLVVGQTQVNLRQEKSTSCCARRKGRGQSSMTCSSSARLATSSQKRSTAATASPVSTAAPASRTSGFSVHMVPGYPISCCCLFLVDRMELFLSCQCPRLQSCKKTLRFLSWTSDDLKIRRDAAAHI